jgi:hypothetical protein
MTDMSNSILLDSKEVKSKATVSAKPIIEEIDWLYYFDITQQKTNKGYKKIGTISLFYASIYSMLLAIIAKIEAHAPKNVDNNARSKAYSSTIYGTPIIKQIKNEAIKFVNYIWRFSNTPFNHMFADWHPIWSAQEGHTDEYMQIPGFTLSNEDGKKWLQQAKLQDVLTTLGYQLHYLSNKVWNIEFDENTPIDLTQIATASGDKFKTKTVSEYSIAFADGLRKHVLFFLNHVPLVQTSENVFSQAGDASKDVGVKLKEQRELREQIAIKLAVETKVVIPPKPGKFVPVISKPLPSQQVSGLAWKNGITGINILRPEEKAEKEAKEAKDREDVKDNLAKESKEQKVDKKIVKKPKHVSKTKTDVDNWTVVEKKKPNRTKQPVKTNAAVHDRD